MSAAKKSVRRTNAHSAASNRTGANQCDVLAIGLNATDTLIRVPRFPAFDSKTKILSSRFVPGRKSRDCGCRLPALGIAQPLRGQDRRRFRGAVAARGVR